MKILLNLLPPAEKAALSGRFRFRFFTWQTTLLFGLELFYVAVLFGILFLLNQNAGLADQSNAAFGEYNTEARKLADYQDKFKVANAAAAETERFTKNHLHWTNLFMLLDRVSSPGVVLVDILTRDYTITVNGQARTREDFLVFEDKLKKSDCVSDVKVPVSNLFSQKEIEFQVDFNLKRECLLVTPK